LDDEAASSIMLAENVQRVELNPIEEARAYQKRMVRFGWDEKRVAQAANVSEARVRLRLTLLDIVPEAQHLVKHGNLGIKFAYALRDLDTNRQRIALRWVRDQENPDIKVFRRLCAELLAEQAQESMFDLVTFMTEVQAEMDLGASDEPKRVIPIDGQLPAMVKARSVGAALERYIAILMSEGKMDAAQVVGSVYRGLLKYGLTSMPKESCMVVASG
jgi:ParB-like chromosome segregation protein Spo0J